MCNWDLIQRLFEIIKNFFLSSLSWTFSRPVLIISTRWSIILFKKWEIQAKKDRNNIHFEFYFSYSSFMNWIKNCLCIFSKNEERQALWNTWKIMSKKFQIYMSGSFWEKLPPVRSGNFSRWQFTQKISNFFYIIFYSSRGSDVPRFSKYFFEIFKS